MQIIKNDKLEESAYIEELDNGLKIIVIPKEGVNKKYAIIGIKFGSIDNCFIDQKTGIQIKIPKWSSL